MANRNNSSQTSTKSKSKRLSQIFWLSFLVLSLAYAGYSFYAPSNNIQWVNNVTTIQDLSKTDKKKTLLFFTGKWCSPCQIMKREVFADKVVEKLVNAQVMQ